MTRRLKDASTLAMIVAVWSIAGAILWWIPAYLDPPIEVISNKVVDLDLVHDRMTTETQFMFRHHCDGDLEGWVRSTGNEPPPREWSALQTLPLPPPGFMADDPTASPGTKVKKTVRGDIVTRRISIPLNGYVPQPGSLYLAERSFRCNLLQRVFPLVVKAPLAVINTGTPD